jgi:hypothetical protein
MAKIANHKIEAHISALAPFVNYNGTIVADRKDGLYEVWHWATKILTYNINTGEIGYLLPSVVSQTTSTLVGRIVRNLPRQAVEQWLLSNPELSNYNRKRFVRMARL